MTFYVYKDRQGEYRWYLEAENHKKIADSGEGYKSKQHCLEAINLVKGSSDASVVEK